MTDLTFKLESQNLIRLLLSFLACTIILLSFYSFFTPVWETNDDVGMAMIAHGLNAVNYASPNLIFSNVVWGYIVRAIPSISGIPGYSIGSLFALLLAAVGILYGLLRFEKGWCIGILAVLLIIMRPMLFPQFTMTSGLLAVAAIMGWQVHARDGDLTSLVFACSLALLGFLIRNDQFILMMAIAIPIFPWRAALQNRRFQVALGLLALTIVLAIIQDNRAYQDAEWQPYIELDAARLPFTDYTATLDLISHPEVLSKHGYSINDVRLLSQWFFVDEKIANPTKLNIMLDEVDHFYMGRGSIETGFLSIVALTSIKLIPLLTFAIVSFLLAPNRKVAAVWVLSLAAIFLMGVLGRPGIFRVYVPMVSLLMVSAIIFSSFEKSKHWFLVALLAQAMIFNFSKLASEQEWSSRMNKQAQQDVQILPEKPVVVWANTLPYNYLYPVLAKFQDLPSHQLYSLDAWTLTPFYFAASEAAAGRDFLTQLRSQQGMALLARQDLIDLLTIYCKEHLKSDLEILDKTWTPTVRLFTVRCTPPV